ncbi:MAG: hypothetical protein EXS08_02385 [Planctomycetes bacterium]|nr:hypothetical protein [Planctomycetota bacterium]
MHQSELALFAQSFQRALAPLAAALRQASEVLRARSTQLELPFASDDLAAQLAALEGELQALLARVAAERATLFVFGPAKSGKSTLLDALTAARVSEVSILPGYPCVRVTRHASEQSALLARFDGQSELVPDPSALALVLQRAHVELCAAVRAVQDRGEPFDAARHLPQALRRSERALCAPLLERSALELVECPPVHGALFPSYAAQLVGEPERARAAVFVVRAAQLCDAATFDGIEDLLAAFERLILVLNLDDRSRELSRAGELVAGPEREDPARLLAAFEELTTSAPLARALHSGRVPVLALDLLEAARARLSGAEDAPVAGAARRSRLGDLLRELGGVLDVHELLHALETSALRRARELLAEARELAATGGLSELHPRRSAAAQERAALERVVLALERLQAREASLWAAEELFEGLRAQLASALGARAAALAQELRAPLARAIEDWFSDGTSLAALMQAALAPRLEAARGELARTAERALRSALAQTSEAGLSLAARTDLVEARVALADLLRPRAGAEGALVARASPALRVLDVSSIPVRPRLGQRLVFRAEDEVRRALLGSPESPERALSSEDKARRLGAEARAALQRSAAERAEAILAEEARALAQHLAQGALAGFVEELHGLCARGRERAQVPARALDARIEEWSALAEALHALAPVCARTEGALAELVERFEHAGVLVPAARTEASLADELEREERGEVVER